MAPRKISVDARNYYLYENYPELWVAINHHKNHKGKMLTFHGRHYLKDIYADRSQSIVVKKGSQCGVSEYLIIRAICAAAAGRGVFYVLPTSVLQGRFVKNRFDKSIEYTPYYRGLISDGNQHKQAESVSLKHFVNGTIAFVGSNASSAFTEFPADDIIIDELDQCNQENLPMAESRLSNSIRPTRIKVANPTLENYGIDAEWMKSDQKRWFIQCSSCNKWIHPDFYNHVIRPGEEPGEYVIRDEEWEPGLSRDIYPICEHCKKPFERFAPGEWRAGNTASEISGYHISKMFSTNVSLRDLVSNFEEGLVNDTKMQVFCNYDLGIAYTSKGAKIDYSMLDECVGDFAFLDSVPEGRCFMGIDVGHRMHVTIGQKIDDRKIKLVYAGTVENEEDVFELARKYKADLGVIDALPETRMSKKICSRLKYFFMIYYTATKSMQVDAKKKIITVDRTVCLDEVKEKILLREYMFPRNIRQMAPMVLQNGIEVSEFYQNMTSSTRLFDSKKEKYDWVHSEPDHYFHSLNYMTIASKIAAQLTRRRQ